ncbi:hypothetical protein GCM10010293_32290 [Streptomyces griseoflavus]|nr:hypothetical protein GCM10010293_32290 [Streptomyces griseoflavus]
MTSPMQEARIAMKAALNNRARTGRTYGHSRSSVRTAERDSGGEGVVGISSEPTVRH